MAAQPAAQAFDYVIVGGGTAGLTVASRLSEDPDITVLVLEAGPDNSQDPLVVIPGMVTGQLGQDKYDWNFTTPPQVSFSCDRPLTIRRAAADDGRKTCVVVK